MPYGSCSDVLSRIFMDIPETGFPLLSLEFLVLDKALGSALMLADNLALFPEGFILWGLASNPPFRMNKILGTKMSNVVVVLTMKQMATLIK